MIRNACFYVSPKYPDSGPVSLYKRVRQVFSTPRLLGIKPERLAKLAKTWPMTPEEMDQVIHFYPEEWTLYEVRVRCDTGKFICTTWNRWIGEKCFFVDIGYGEKVERLRWARSDYIDDLWLWCDNNDTALVEFVESVNATLLAENAPFTPPVRPLPPKTGETSSPAFGLTADENQGETTP